MKIKAKGHGDPRISSDAYFLGLCILWTSANSDMSRALIEEIQRIGRFELNEGEGSMGKRHV